MEYKEAKALHEAVGFVGLRAHATAVGLVQLCTELVRAGVIDDATVGRIKDAIASDIALSRPPSMTREAFEQTTRRRLDALFSGQEKVSDTRRDSSRGLAGSTLREEAPTGS